MSFSPNKLKLLRLIVVGVLFVSSNSSSAEPHPVCQSEIAGITLNQSVMEIENIWKNSGLQDITCSQRSKVPCNERRKQMLTYATNPNGSLEKVNDKIYMLTLNYNTGQPKSLVARTKTDAPAKLEAYTENRSWQGWTHQDLIEAKIKRYCNNAISPEDNIITKCQYRSALSINVIVGSPLEKECTYKFDARYHTPRGKSQAPNDHAIVETLILQ